MFEKGVQFYSGVQALQATPDALRARHTIALAPQMAAYNADRQYRLLQGWRLFVAFTFAFVIRVSRPTLCIQYAQGGHSSAKAIVS